MRTLFLAWAVSAIFGMIPTGYLVGRSVGKIDLRAVGSGSVGATNVLRALGRGWGAFVFGVDFFKGFLPLFIFLQTHAFDDSISSWAVWAGSGAILGHIFNPFLGFKGGKGVATGAGVVCAAFPAVFLVSVCVWLGVFALTRIVSLSSLTAITILSIFGIFRERGFGNAAFFIFSFLLIYWSHRENLGRLIRGEERGFK